MVLFEERVVDLAWVEADQSHLRSVRESQYGAGCSANSGRGGRHQVLRRGEAVRVRSLKECQVLTLREAGHGVGALNPDIADDCRTVGAGEAHIDGPRPEARR